MQYSNIVKQNFLSLSLSNISAKVNPYKLIKYHFPSPSSINVAFSASSSKTKISQRKCTNILFAKIKKLAKMFSFFKQNKTLIKNLIKHFKYKNSSNFHSQQLNLSFHKKINKYSYNSPIQIIKKCIKNSINSTPSTKYQPLILQSIKTKLLSSKLNKFNNFKNSFNSLKISVHNISAQKISLLSFQKYAIK